MKRTLYGRSRKSGNSGHGWTPACAGVTALRTGIGCCSETGRYGHCRKSGNPLRLAALFLGVLLAAQVASAQVTTGVPPFSSLTPSSFDTVDNANLNVNFGIPIFSRAGLGIPFSYVLGYNSSLWSPVTATGSYAWTPVPSSNWGWQAITAAQAGYVSF